ncbi:MAG: rhamnulokinase family protein [Thermoproteota archaeon]
MTNPKLLAFDLGAESGRAIVGTLTENKIQIEEIYRFPNVPVKIESHIFWDVLRIWNEIKSAISLANSKFRENLRSVGVDAWGVDFVLLDNNGELLSNPHHYRDPRTEGIFEEVFKKVQREEIYYRTGIQFLRINTLYQLYSLVLSKSSMLKAASKFLMIPDLFNYWLSNTKVSEFTDATTTQFYNPSKNNWDYELLEKLNIPTHFLPEIVKPGTVLGTMSKSLVNELNLNSEISVVAPACHDTGSAVAAAPLEDESSVYISSGTWSLVGVEVSKPIINKSSLEYNFTNEGGVFGKFRLLRNVQGMWLVQECKRVWASYGKNFSYEELTQLASKSRKFISFIDPDDQRFLAPKNMLEEILSYLEESKQEKPKNEGELIRIILESLAFKYKFIIKKIEELTGNKIKQINIVGGGSRNWLLNQLTADFTGVKVVAGPVEATSVGNLLMQAYAMDMVNSHKELRSIVKNSFELKEFEPKQENLIDEAYNRFCSVISSSA